MIEIRKSSFKINLKERIKSVSYLPQKFIDMKLKRYRFFIWGIRFFPNTWSYYAAPDASQYFYGDAFYRHFRL